jgi:hypothetical protein
MFLTERTLILTRDKHPSSGVLKTAKKALENNNISKSTLNESAQHKCPEYNFSDVTRKYSFYLQSKVLLLIYKE